jgi:hypothetical protein
MDNHLKLTERHSWFAIECKPPIMNMLSLIDPINPYNNTPECLLYAKLTLEYDGLIGIIYSERSSQNLIPRVSEGV